MQDTPPPEGSPAAAPNPNLSSDGRFWWNGAAWVPVTPTPSVVYVTASAYPASKSKVAAGLLGIFLGGLGIHKFYLGQVGLGIVYILFCWTFIPEIIGFIEGIIYLVTSDAEWARKYPPLAYAPPVSYGPPAR